MREWKNAEVVELNVSATAQGGKNLAKIDHFWTDSTTQDLYASYASGGTTIGDSIEVIKK